MAIDKPVTGQMRLIYKQPRESIASGLHSDLYGRLRRLDTASI